MSTPFHQVTESKALADEFELQHDDALRDPEQLRKACVALENVDWDLVWARDQKWQLRKDALAAWLRLAEVIDQCIDAEFDQEDEPELPGPPLPTIDGVTPPGADSSCIPDPELRAAYEREKAAMLAKAERYRVQLGLREAADRIAPRLLSFLDDAYRATPGTAEREELRVAVERARVKPERKVALLRSCGEAAVVA